MEETSNKPHTNTGEPTPTQSTDIFPWTSKYPFAKTSRILEGTIDAFRETEQSSTLPMPINIMARWHGVGPLVTMITYFVLNISGV